MMRLLVAIVVGLAAASPAAAEPVRIEVDPDERFQTIDGWGTCLVAWVPAMRDYYRTDAFTRLYVDEMGANMLRINLWGGVHDTPVDTPEEIRHEDFDFSVSGGRPQIFIDVGKKLLGREPEMKFIGSVWSPPAWMKLNRAITDDRSGAIVADAYEKGDRTFDNRVDPRYFEHFAQWVVEMVKYHDAAGTPLYAVSPSNEPMFTQSFESCVWTADDLATVTSMIRKRLDEQGYEGVKIFAPETMTGHNFAHGNPPYIKALSTGDAGQAHDIWATHGYTDGVDADVSANSSADFWQLIKDSGKPYWVTEGGTGGHDWPEPLQGAAAMMHNALVHGHASAIVPWQIVGQNPSTHSLTLMDGVNKKGDAARHYWRFVRPGAVRIAATPSESHGVAVSAFVHDEDDLLTLVLLNTADEDREVSLALGDLSLRVLEATRTDADNKFDVVGEEPVTDGKVMLTLPAESITTLQGRLR
jgi:O-glycosyl hydrolase